MFQTAVHGVLADVGKLHSGSRAVHLGAKIDFIVGLKLKVLNPEAAIKKIIKCSQVIKPSHEKWIILSLEENAASFTRACCW